MLMKAAMAKGGSKEQKVRFTISSQVPSTTQPPFRSFIYNHLGMHMRWQLDDWILQSDTVGVNRKNASNLQPDGRESSWQKTPYANLVRYAPSGKYFARIRVGGKLIRQSLKTKVLSVAKLKRIDPSFTETVPGACPGNPSRPVRTRAGERRIGRVPRLHRPPGKERIPIRDLGGLRF